MQFCLELAFGVLVALCFVPRAPVGRFFYRIMGTTAAVALLGALSIPIATGSRIWSDRAVLSTLLALLAYPLYSGPGQKRYWRMGIGLAAFGCMLGVACLVGSGARELGTSGLLLATSSALATGTVAGSVGLAMVLGHWYLTVPNLDVAHLRRLNRVTVGSIVVSSALVGLSCCFFSSTLNEGPAPLFGPFGLFFLVTRVTAGLVLPLLFAGMAASALRFRNTRSATGILYASTVLVLIGTAVSISLQGSYGLPL